MTHNSLVWFTDVHAASSNPINRRDDYPQAILDKLRQVKKLAEKLKCPMVCGGDVFHHKAPSKVAHWLTNELIEMWRANPPVGVIGNHDLSWDSLEHIHRQPIEGLIRAGAYKALDHDTPAVQQNGFSIRGCAYRSKLDPEWFRWPQGVDDGRTLKVLILHVAASPTGSDFPGDEECYSYPWLAQNSDADVILLGHWHIDQGIQAVASPGKMLGQTYFVNIGALCRPSIADVGRQPKACLIQWDQGARDLKLVEVVLKHGPGREVLAAQEAAEQKTRDIDSTAFLDRLQQGALFTFDIESMIKESDAPAEVRAAALRIYQGVE